MTTIRISNCDFWATNAPAGAGSVSRISGDDDASYALVQRSHAARGWRDPGGGEAKKRPVGGRDALGPNPSLEAQGAAALLRFRTIQVCPKDQPISL
jgi:hypothetical protein